MTQTITEEEVDQAVGLIEKVLDRRCNQISRGGVTMNERDWHQLVDPALFRVAYRNVHHYNPPENFLSLIHI